MSVVRIRESPYYRGFLKKIYENFVGTLKTVCNIEVSVLERCPYREVRLYIDSRFILPFGCSRTALKGCRLPPSTLEKTRGCSLAIIGKAQGKKVKRRNVLQNCHRRMNKSINK